MRIGALQKTNKMSKPSKKLTATELKTLEEYVRSKGVIKATKRQKVLKPRTFGFDHRQNSFQKRFIADLKRYIHLCAGRRGGKTFGIIIKALKVCLAKKNALCWFIAPTLSRARNIFWGMLKKIEDQYHIGIDFNDSSLTATIIETGSEIRLTGCDDLFSANKFRGIPADLFVIDEAASFRNDVLKYLIRESIHYAMIDFADSQLILSGTPGQSPVGFFHDADERNNPSTTWSCYTWTIRDNEFFDRFVDEFGIPKANWKELAEQILEEDRREFGLSEDNSAFRREWLAEWSNDSAGMYYVFDKAKNVIPSTQLPNNLKHVIGFDVGLSVDPTAYVILGYNEQDHDEVYVIREKTLLAPVLTGKIVSELKALYDEFKPEYLIGDYAGAGQAIFDIFYERYDIHIEPCVKRGGNDKSKAGITGMMNSELHEGRLLISDTCTNLIQELQTVRWNELTKELDGSIPNDHCDALQYGWLKTYGFMHDVIKKRRSKKLAPHEQIQKEVDDWWEEDEQRTIEKQQNRDWVDDYLEE